MAGIINRLSLYKATEGNQMAQQPAQSQNSVTV